ncbi:hypothetical protein ELI03_14185 [Rhizobium leguminosarum]|uniref:Uncharacterized protein n=1 Tax=Rhizobium leguminosarum TaxID=384 RepID=A0A4Q8Y4T2_RHILE|nr:hypothetical protein [Rhizobium leguminosarum]TAX72815.1 hypothetical protein ELI03_14185 [Rhizobium leguminosarum]
MTNFMNPFRPVKFEDEGAPLIYISDLAMQQFTAGNYFFTGKRGCGKTSILKVSDTIFQTENPYIRVSENVSKYRDTFGVYINLNNRSIPNFFQVRRSSANKKYLVSEASKHALTTFYLELIILHKIVEYCILLRDCAVFSVDEDCENAIANGVCAEYGVPTARNLDHLLLQVESVMVEMLEFSRSVRDDLPSFKLRTENKYHLVVGQVLRALQAQNGHLRQIRILIDDCETFPPEFQAALNSLIRAPRGQPIAWSIAYVDGKYRATATNIENQTLSREERTIIYLDGLDTAEYEKFCVEVTRLRVKRAFPNIRDFSIKEKLSSFEIDELCEESFRTTTSKRARDFIDRFQHREDKSRKLWEMFLTESNAANVQSNDALRKRALASYICMCAKYRVPMYYAGFKTVTGLSDGCIRDFLEVLGSLYEQVTLGYEEPTRFLDRTVYDIAEQDRGCREAADRKLKSISDYAEKNGYYLAKLVRFLGHLVQAFQHDYTHGHALRSPDRAAFSIEAGQNTEEYVDLIKDAEVDGYVRRVDQPTRPGVYCFRLHRQFAPNFDVAYREPSDDLIPIPYSFLRQIKDREVENAAEWAKRLYDAWVRKKSNVAQRSFLDEEGA